MQIPDEGHFRVNTVLIASIATCFAILGSVAVFWNSRERQLWANTWAVQQIEIRNSVYDKRYDTLVETLSDIRKRQNDIFDVMTINSKRIAQLEADFKSFRDMYFLGEKRQRSKFQKPDNGGGEDAGNSHE